jgi:phosphohistidine phosphatase SixA
MIDKDTYLVRHGHYNHQTGKLDEQGILDAERATYKLLELGVVHTALVLASDTPRGLQTGEIIADRLDASVLPSRRVNLGGNRPECINDLDDLLNKALDDADASLEGNSSLVVITHEPLIRVALHGTRKSDLPEPIRYGDVIPYVHGSWLNQDYSSLMAKLLEHEVTVDKR